MSAIEKEKPDMSEGEQLTEKQIRALRWLEENEQTRSEWTHNGKYIKSRSKKEWTHFRVSGPEGSILIAEQDLRALDPYISICPKTSQMYGANEAGRALLEKVSA